MSPSKDPLPVASQKGQQAWPSLTWIHVRAGFRLPAIWVSAVALLAWPGTLGLLPVGITVRFSTINGLVYELAFLGAILGAVAGVAGVGGIRRDRWLTRALGPTEAWLADFCPPALLGLLFAGLASLIPFFWGLAGPKLVWATLLTVAHLAALGSMLQHVPMPRGLRPALLVALAWWIPALAATPELGLLTERLWAARYLSDTLGVRWADTVSVVALVLISWLLATATSPKPIPRTP